MKRVSLIILALVCFTSLLPANPSFSAAEQKAVDDLLQYRMEVSALHSADAVTGLHNWKAQNLTAAKTAGFSEEAKLILDAMVELEAISYLQCQNCNDTTIKDIAEAQYNALQAWMDAHPSETPNAWTYCMAAEAFNWYLSYLSVAQIMTKGLLPKQYYQKALEVNPGLSYAMVGLAQWQYYAPAISGGGERKSRTTHENALKAAVTKVDEFTAHLYYSQILFQMKDKAGAERELAAAEAIQPGSMRVARFRQVNAAGFSWYEFTRDYEDNLKTLGAPLVN